MSCNVFVTLDQIETKLLEIIVRNSSSFFREMQ